MPLFPILNAGWLQIGVSAFTMHDMFIPPVVPLPNMPGLIEGPAFMGWPPGRLSHKTGEDKVHVDGNPGVQQGHDIGYVIPHFAIPMNAMCAVHTLLSKHKVMFPVTHTQIRGKAAGTYVLFLFGLICANPVSLPSGVVMLLKCTVWTTLGAADILRGLLRIAVDVLFDFLWYRYVRVRLPRIPLNAWQVIEGLTLREIAEDVPLLLARRLLVELGNKVIAHVLKTWVASPAVTNLPQGRTGIGRGNRFYRSHPFFRSPL
jgi:hypothetical protein